jgi:hypothetical protein
MTKFGYNVVKRINQDILIWIGMSKCWYAINNDTETKSSWNNPNIDLALDCIKYKNKEI